jgi:hypothetical protein
MAVEFASVPNPRGPHIKALTTRTPRDAIDGCSMCGQRDELAAALGVPDFDEAVIASASDPPAVGTPSHRSNVRCVAADYAKLAPRGCVPDDQLAVGATRGHAAFRHGKRILQMGYVRNRTTNTDEARTISFSLLFMGQCLRLNHAFRDWRGSSANGINSAASPRGWKTRTVLRP